MKRCACVLFIGLTLSFAAHADGGYYPGYGYPPGYSNGYNAPVYGNGGYVAYPGYGRQAYRNPYYPEGRRGWGSGGREERREHEWREHEWREHNGWGGRGWGGRYGRD